MTTNHNGWTLRLAAPMRRLPAEADGRRPADTAPSGVDGRGRDRTVRSGRRERAQPQHAQGTDPLAPAACHGGTVSQTATIAAIVLSCWGTLGMLKAHERGWRPDARLLFRLGAMTALAVANLTPVGSSDTASYAAYGRIAALGGDPYVTTPARLGGAYAHLVSEAWRNTLPCTGRWRRGGRAPRRSSVRSGRG